MNNAQIQSLTGVRFFAAIWVVCYHFKGFFHELLPWLDPLQWLFAKGDLAVPFFFILSGFILSYNYHSYKLSFHLEFIWRRFARLWPVHFATLCMFYSCFYAASKIGVYCNTSNFNLTVLPPELLMVRSWYDTRFMFNIPAWSIQAEWFAYIFIFPFCYFLFRKKRHISVEILVPFFLLVVYALFPMRAIPGKLSAIIFPFIAGAALYRLRKSTNQFNNSGFWVWVSVCGIFLFLGSPYLSSVLKTGLFPFFGMLIFALSYEKGIVNDFLKSRLLLYGGAISYSLYMTHHFIECLYFPVFARLHLVNPLAKSFAGILVFLGTLGLAAFFYHFIEEPSHRFLRKVKIKSLFS